MSEPEGARKMAPTIVPMTVLDKPVKASCTRCPHIGTTRSPSLYMCGACYYAARARASREQAVKLRARADKLEAEAEVFEGKAKAFEENHPGAGQRTEPIPKGRLRPGVWDKR